MSEQVYCVPAERLPSPQPKALALTADLYALLVNEGQFLTRADVEEDPSWRQIIPYAVIQCEGQVLLVERLKAGSESRLHNKMSIGMGGHINPQDHTDDNQKTAPQKTAPEQDVLEAALVRELREELVIGGFAFEATGTHSPQRKCRRTGAHRAFVPCDRARTGCCARNTQTRRPFCAPFRSRDALCPARGLVTSSTSVFTSKLRQKIAQMTCMT